MKLRTILDEIRQNPLTTKLIAETKVPNVFRKLVKAFPISADSWRDATDELREIVRDCRKWYNEVVLDAVESDEDDDNNTQVLRSMDWRSFKTPSEWNTKGINELVRIYNMLPPNEQKRFIIDIKERFPKLF